ncbi:uncharacterized protein LOC135121401 isoform X2 [Zophobas morio]|uniref:uncharacterized protein LOC135121401 isoform X2 n=1 Tax=Zophobas morio TaxID=2755281 RepID=UPI00308307C7
MDLNNLKEEAKTNKGTALLQEKLSLIKQRCEELQVALDFNLNSVNKALETDLSLASKLRQELELYQKTREKIAAQRIMIFLYPKLLEIRRNKHVETMEGFDRKLIEIRLQSESHRLALLKMDKSISKLKNRLGISENLPSSLSPPWRTFSDKSSKHNNETETQCKLHCKYKKIIFPLTMYPSYNFTSSLSKHIA